MRIFFRKLWRNSPILMLVCAAMLAAFVFSLAGLLLDPRTITGQPAWLKPAKFAISTAIFTGTMAWLVGYLTVWPAFVRGAAWTIGLAITFEVAVIDLQAARGTVSHFNIATPLDQTLFALMGAGIGILWLGSAGIFAALLRQPFRNRAWGWALRLGLFITLAGSGMGGLMTRTTPEQKLARQLHQHVGRNGGHTVGAPDGGPGLPVVGWSEDHGDLRVPHFLGLHAIQAIALLGWMVNRRGTALGLTITGAASYFGLVAILVWQALRGQALLEPDGLTLNVLALWAVATAASVAYLALNPRAALLNGRTA